MLELKKITKVYKTGDFEQKALDEGVSVAKDAVIEIIKNNVDSAMNKYNKKKEI